MIVKDYVREHHRRRREMFAPLPYGVEPVLPSERWTEMFPPNFLSDMQFATNGPEPILFRAADITMAAI